MNACPVRNRKRVDSASRGGFCQLLILLRFSGSFTFGHPGGCVTLGEPRRRKLCPRSSGDERWPRGPSAGVLSLLKLGSSRETRALPMVILSLLKVRRNLSATFLSNGNVLCGVWTQVASLTMQVAPDLPRTQGLGLQQGSVPALCQSVSPHVAPLPSGGKRPLGRYHTSRLFPSSCDAAPSVA